MSSSTLATRRYTASGATFVILGLLALVATFSWRSTAAAEGSYPPPLACVVSTSGPATPGSTPTLVGSGFAANETVALSLQPGNTSLGSVLTNGTGAFSQQVSIPSNLTGSHTIQAAAASSTCSFGPLSDGSGTGGSGIDGVSAGSQGVTSGIAGVTASRGLASTGLASTGLASTGFATVTASAIGLALLAGGAMFIIVGRRRKA